MAVKAEIFGAGPGIARIRLTGAELSAARSEIQIRRNQTPDSYLGLGGQWQASPECWHPVVANDISTIQNGVEFTVGPQLVDPILQMQGQNVFRLTLRNDGKAETAVLVLSSQHPLLASAARNDTPVAQPEPPPAQTTPELETVEIVPPPRPITADPADRHTGEKRSHAKGILALGIVVLLAAGAGAYWYSGQSGGAVDQPSDTSATVPQSTREMLQGFMKDSPDAAAIVGKADQMKTDGNIDAAVYLYRQGADRGDAKSALQLGLLYDPAEAPVAGNTLTKSSDTAAFWYGKAADAGLAEAKRRLGTILTKGHAADSGEYANGIALLKAASQQGDAEATARLKELGQ